MRDRDAQAREIMKAIGSVLLSEWDPIGVKDGGPQDEYDSYIGGVYRLLVSGATAAQVAEHLRKIEAESMGFRETSAVSLLPIAEKLLKLDVKLKRGSVA